MLYVLCGPSCAGKSTVAAALKERLGARVYTGKDYLRLARSEAEARACLLRELRERAGADSHAAVVLTETDLVAELRAIAGARFVRCTAPKEILIERFIARSGGKANPAFAAMIDRQAQKWDAIPCDSVVDTGGSADVEASIAMILGD